MGGDPQPSWATAALEEISSYVEQLATSLHQAISQLQRSAVVVVAAVQGPAAGAGVPLATAADIVLAGRS